jgi:hypothetical protein
VTTTPPEGEARDPADDRQSPQVEDPASVSVGEADSPVANRRPGSDEANQPPDENSPEPRPRLEERAPLSGRGELATARADASKSRRRQWATVIRFGATLPLILVALLAQYPVSSWVDNWYWSGTLAVGLPVVTVVVGLVLLTLIVVHVVLLTRPFPHPPPTQLKQENHRLGEIAAAIHSVIEAGRRR